MRKSRFDKPFEKRMGFIGTALKFWVILNPYIKRVFAQFDGFHQRPVRGKATES